MVRAADRVVAVDRVVAPVVGVVRAADSAAVVVAAPVVAATGVAPEALARARPVVVAAVRVEVRAAVRVEVPAVARVATAVRVGAAGPVARRSVGARSGVATAPSSNRLRSG